MSHHRGKIWPGRADMPARPGKPLVRADSGYQSNQTHPAASSRPNRYSVAGDSTSAESLRVTTGGSRPAPCNPCRPHPSRFSGSSPFNALRPGIQRTPPRRRANEQMRGRGRADGTSQPTETPANELMPHHHPVQFRESCRQSGVAMRRIILLVFGGLLAAALLISPAHAVKPVIVPQSQ